MPAYHERVYLYPDQIGQPVWIGEFPLWWDRRQFFDKFGSRSIDTGHPIYVDYGLLLAPAEALAWDKECREAFASDPRSQQAEIKQAMQQWGERLLTARWVIVESYEWESGLE